MNSEKKELISKLELLQEDYKVSREIYKRMDNPKIDDDFVIEPLPEEPTYQEEEDLTGLKKPKRVHKGAVIAVIIFLLIIASLFVLYLKTEPSSFTLTMGGKDYLITTPLLEKIGIILNGLIVIIIIMSQFTSYQSAKAKYDAQIQSNTDIKASNATLREEYYKQVQAHEASVKEHEKYITKLKKQVYDQIDQEEYQPLLAKMEEENDGTIGEKYYPKLKKIIEFLKNGQADTIKEALHLLEDTKYKDKQFKLEKKKAEQEQQDRQSAMALQEKIANDQNELKKLEIQAQRDNSERIVNEQNNKAQQVADQQKEKDEQMAQELCRRCAKQRTCSMKDKNPNCPAFKAAKRNIDD